MNERIKEIANQAMIDASETDIEKFGELIVQECLKIIVQEQDRVSSDQWVCKDGLHLYYKIQDTLGNKE